MDLPVLGIQALIAHSGVDPSAYDPRRGIRVSGPLLPTVDEVVTREKLVDGKFKTMDADVTANVDPSSSASARTFVGNWQSFKKTWDDFFAGHQTFLDITWPFGPGIGTIDRQVTEFENELAGWRTALGQIAPTARLQTPPIQSSQGSQIQPSLTTLQSRPLPTWAVVAATLAGVGLVGYLGYRAYEALSPTAHLADLLRRRPSRARGRDPEPESEADRDDRYEYDREPEHDARGEREEREEHRWARGRGRYAGDYGPSYRGVPVE